MSYRVIHLIEAAHWLGDLEYSQLVEQCEQIYSFLSAEKDCAEQICLTFSDHIKEVISEDGWWPGECAFLRPRSRRGKEKQEKKICLEAALTKTAEIMSSGGVWIIILYTAGGVRRPKRTMLSKWKRTVLVPLSLLAVKTDEADASFLETYTEADKIFEIRPQSGVIQWLKEFRKYCVF